MRRRGLFFVLHLLVVAALTAAAHLPSLPDAAERAAGTIAANDLRAHVGVLASDELQGRGTGHVGNELAALYIASLFERLGLSPAAGRSFLQPIDLYFTTLGPANELLVGAGPRGRYGAGVDFQPHALSAVRSVTAPLLFAGYGITAPDRQYDDYAGLDARGRLVIALDGEPPARPTAVAGSTSGPGAYVRAEHKIANARAHGAAGLLLVRARLGDPRGAWPENPSVRARAYQLADRVDAARLPVAWLSVTAADAILADRDGGKHRIATLRTTIDRTVVTSADRAVASPASFVLDGPPVRLTIDLTHRRTVVHNVIAMVEGADPARRRELVVLGAHLDHDGIDADGRIYNGSDDNASGTAAVLEAAEAFATAAEAGSRPDRTVVFALWNGEEKGLLGSRHYLEDPQPTGGRVVANVNLDMVGREEDVPDPNDYRFLGLGRTAAAENVNTLHVIGYSYSPSLAAVIRQENATVGLILKETLDDSASNLLRRSDHWPFLQRGIPAVFLTTGLHPDYHTPRDDTALINFAKLERISRLAYRVAWRLATDPSVPTYRTPPVAEPSRPQ